MPAASGSKPPATVLVGTSGFGYHEWSPSFYPPELCYEEYLPHYARHFPFCELSRTFFHLPSAGDLDTLASQVPESFRFSVKLFRGLTHERPYDLAPARRFAESLSPLVESGRLAAVLAQFPFSFVNNPASRAYLCRLRAALDLPLVAELRNDSWLAPETLSFLEGWGIGFASSDVPDLAGLPAKASVATSPIGYVRFHGRRDDAWWVPGSPDRYDYRYRRRELLAWVPRVREIARRSSETFVVFNNRRHGHAVTNAASMSRLLSRVPRRVSASARAG